MAKDKPELSIDQRAQRVISSQGKPALLFKSATPHEIATLAAMCDEFGTVAADAPQRFFEFRMKYYADRKATDAADDEPLELVSPVAEIEVAASQVESAITASTAGGTLMPDYEPDSIAHYVAGASEPAPDKPQE